MKKLAANILIVLLMIVLVGGVFAPSIAHAQLANPFATFVKFALPDFSTIIGWLGGVILEISARILAISGMLLNSAMNVTLNMSHLVNETEAISATWRVIRDFASIFFIFMLLYASISLIIGRDNFRIKELIPKIILVGILINFSLFFTKVVIDASNVAALGFYNAIAPAGDTTVTDLSGGLGLGLYAKEGGISNVFMQALGVVTIYNPGAISKAKEDFTDKSIPALYFGSVIMIIAAGSFLAVSLMLLVRIVILMLLMAFSPLYFLGWVLPNTQGWASKWTSTLIGQAVFPVVYLALVYVSLKILGSFRFLNEIQKGGKSAFSEAFIAGDNIAIIFNYMVVIILLWMALGVAAKLMGESGKYSNYLIGQMKKLGMGAVNGAKGGVMWAGRNTAGRAASKVASSEGLKDWASKGGIVGVGVLKGARGIAGGYDKQLKTQVESRTKFAKSLGFNQDRVLQGERTVAGLSSELSDLNATIKNPASPREKADAEAEKKRVEADLKSMKKAIGETKNERLMNFAQHEDPREIDPRTGEASMSLFDRVIKKKGYVARKEKVAAAEIKVEILEKELKRLEEDLNEVKPDVKRLEGKKKSEKGLTTDEQRDLDEASIKKSNLEDQIREKKLEISTYKAIE